MRQSHFGSGYDAGKARLQAEVEQLRAQLADYKAGAAEEARAGDEARAQLAAQTAVVEALRFFDQTVVEKGWGNAEALELAYRRVHWRLARIDAAGASAASTGENEQ